MVSLEQEGSSCGLFQDSVSPFARRYKKTIENIKAGYCALAHIRFGYFSNRNQKYSCWSQLDCYITIEIHVIYVNLLRLGFEICFKQVSHIEICGRYLHSKNETTLSCSVTNIQLILLVAGGHS